MYTKFVRLNILKLLKCIGNKTPNVLAQLKASRGYISNPCEYDWIMGTGHCAEVGRWKQGAYRSGHNLIGLVLMAYRDGETFTFAAEEDQAIHVS